MNLSKITSNKIYQKITLVLISIITVISFTFNLTDVNNIINFTNPFKVGTLTLFILGLFLYKYYSTFYFKNRKLSNIFRILSISFSIFMIFGNSYKSIGSWDLIFGNIKVFLISIILFIGYYLFFNRGINLIFDNVSNNKVIKNKAKNNKVLNFIFNKHPFLSTFIILVICYLPYIIAFYPGILSPDPSNQIKQFFGLDVQYREYVIMLDENVNITNHHPVLHTVLLGGCVWIGRLFNSDNLGIFLYSIIQITMLISLFSYIIYYMKKLNTPIYVRLISLLIYALVPVFPLYSMSLVKDVIFSILVIFYIIQLFDLSRNCNDNIYSTKKIIMLIILMTLITLFRNNGIYLIIMSFPFLLIIDKNNRKKILMTLIMPIIIYFSFTDILLPVLKVTPGSIREMLSIPFQQTARYVKEYKDEVTLYEKKVIDKVLGYDDLATRYKPEISDPVKNNFNKYATKEDLNNYFKVWFQDFFKHPNVYLEATINNTYGYFYPGAKNWYIYYKYDKRLNDTNKFDYHYNSLKSLRTVLSNYGLIFPDIPILGIIVNIGFSTWICMLIFAFILELKKYKYLIYLTPVISLVLVCIASPVNTYFRYTLGYVFAIPIIISIFLYIVNERKSSKDE